MVAIKNAKLIKELYPDTRVYILHNGIQAYGADFEDYYRAARERGVRFVKYSPEKPPEVTGTKGKSKMHEKLKVTVYHELLRRTMEIHCELVVLSAPLVAPQDTAMLSKLLKVPLGQDRFFLEAHVKLRPLDFATDGVYLCGTAHGPADVAEATAQALGAAARAAIPMARGFVRPETITPLVDTDKCTACGICVSVCPFGAITLAPTDKGRKAQPVPAACKGCGCCGASCIRKAITMQHYTDAQLLAQGRAALAPGTIESEKPVEVN
jgi:heterodisulfide reductase subunit A